ncbi:MAG: inosine/xanthosine triphosphatase [Patescibacteria group bacterium]
MHIFVGSTNPVKLNAVVSAASETWPDVIIEGFDVKSGVTDQPRSDEETKKGAENRAKEALRVGLAKHSAPVQVLGIGLEGGVFENEQQEMWNTVWACVVDQTGKTVFANGERFHLPDSLTTQIRAGKEMGPAMDELIGSTNIKHQQGMIGVITEGFIDRTELYANLAKLALGLWSGQDWETKIR